MFIFQSAAKRTKSLFPSVGVSASARMEYGASKSLASRSQRDYVTLVADLVIVGAAAALIALEQCKGLRKSFGKGDMTKAAKLSSVLSWAMVAPWSRFYLSYGENAKGLLLGKQQTCELIFIAFGLEPTPGEIQVFLQVDAQFNQSMDTPDDRGDPGEWVFLLYSQCLEACGVPTGINWSTLSVPFDTGGQELPVKGLEAELRNLYPRVLWGGWGQTIKLYCMRARVPVPSTPWGPRSPFAAIEELLRVNVAKQGEGV